jgi:hypothetical protein
MSRCESPGSTVAAKLSQRERANPSISIRRREVADVQKYVQLGTELCRSSDAQRGVARADAGGRVSRTRHNHQQDASIFVGIEVA